MRQEDFVHDINKISNCPLVHQAMRPGLIVKVNSVNSNSGEDLEFITCPYCREGLDKNFQKNCSTCGWSGRGERREVCLCPDLCMSNYSLWKPFDKYCDTCARQCGIYGYESCGIDKKFWSERILHKEK